MMGGECGALMNTDYTLQRLFKQGELRVIDAADVEWNIQNHGGERYQGGEAVVHIVEWHNRSGAPSSWTIDEGLRVALKVYRRRPNGQEQPKAAHNEDDAKEEGRMAHRMQRKEVNVLDILRRIGCADSIPTLLGAFQREGSAQKPPLYGYAMPAYPHGSLNRFLHRTCAGLDKEFASFFGGAKLAAHYAKLHDVLRRLGGADMTSYLLEQPAPAEQRDAGPLPARTCPRPRGLLLQDISSNNLLLKPAGQGCEVLFSDPSRAEPIDGLERAAEPQQFISATWVWGSMAARQRLLDERSDVHSLNMCMLELWAVAEGSPVALAQLLNMLRPGNNMDTGVTFMRALCTAMLKQHAMGADVCGIVPRTRRELPMSWLMLWAILLGCDDFHRWQEMRMGRRHRRPSVADMADVSARLAAVAAQMEGLEGGVTAAALEAPAGAALVQCCVQLFNRLAALTRLDDPDLLPADASLRWVATHLLQQDHPLVAAMNRQGDLAVGPGYRCIIRKFEGGMQYFHTAVAEAQREAKWESGQQVLDRCGTTMLDMCQEYRQLQLEVLRIAPPGSQLALWVRTKDAALPPTMKGPMERAMSLGNLPPLPEPPAEAAWAAQPFQPARATALAFAAAAAPVAQPAAQGAEPAGAHAVPAAPVQQSALLHELPPQPMAAPLPPTAPVLQPIAPPSALGPPLGAHPLQQAPQRAAAHPLTATQLGQGAVEQPGPSDQPTATLLLQQLLMGVQPTGPQPTFPSSPGPLATSSALGQALGGPFPLDVSAAFGLGYSPRPQASPGLFSQARPPGGGAWQAGTAAAAAAGVASLTQEQPEAAAAMVPRQPGSPPKRPRLGNYSSAAGTAPPASPAALAQPKPHAFCGLFAAPGPAAAGQPAPPPAPVPQWLRLLRERGPLEAAGELGRVGASGPSSSSPVPGPDAGSLAASLDSPLLSSEGRRMALALAGGLSLQPDSNRNYKKTDVERYADALERLLTSPLPPAGLEAQHALFRPINTAAKLAWFLGWWASKERKAPLIPGLDGGMPKAMECSNHTKAAWTKAVLDAAAEGGKFSGTVDAAYRYTMPYAAQALLQRLLVRSPLFAAAVTEEMQKM